MRNGKYAKRGMATKTLVLVLALLTLMGATIGGTLAWLTDKTDAVTNTFTVGDINITLEETFNKDSNNDGEADSWEGKLIPGTDLVKDPKVTVLANSEDCWLFVTVKETSWPDVAEDNGTRKVNYKIADGWKKLEDGVYYREVAASTAAQPFDVLKDNEVTVSSTLTKTEMEAITDNFTLTITAYAVQKENIATAALAWAEVKP